MPQKLKVENTAVNSLEQVAVDWLRVKRSRVSQDIQMIFGDHLSFMFFRT